MGARAEHTVAQHEEGEVRLDPLERRDARRHTRTLALAGHRHALDKLRGRTRTDDLQACSTITQDRMPRRGPSRKSGVAGKFPRRRQPRRGGSLSTLEGPALVKTLLKPPASTQKSRLPSLPKLSAKRTVSRREESKNDLFAV